MLHETKRLTECFDERTFTMQSTTERDQWARIFPLVMPATHRLVHEWDSTGLKLIVRTELIPPAASPSEASDVKPPAPAGPDPKLVAELDAMSEAELKTRAAEKRVKLTKNMNKAEIIAAIIAGPMPS